MRWTGRLSAIVLAAMVSTPVLMNRAAADALPSLNDILNASQRDVRSADALPKREGAEVIEARADAPLRQTFHVGRNVTRLAKIAVWFSEGSANWTPEKSLVMRLYAGQDFSRVLAETDDPYSRRSWEDGVHVFTLNVAVTQNTDYTFELTVHGGRALDGAALANPAALDGVGPLMRNGENLPGALWFETSVKRRSDLDQLYLNVFAHFDLLRPEMRPVRIAVGNRDWDAAKRTLIAHFEGRLNTMPDQTSGSGTSDAASGASIAAADLVVRHSLPMRGETLDLGPRWTHLATGLSKGAGGAVESEIRRLLAVAYARTHLEKYAKAWNAMLRFQFEDFPPGLRAGTIPVTTRESSATAEAGLEGGSVLDDRSAAARLARGFTDYRAFRSSPSFDADTRFAFIADLALTTDVLERMSGGRSAQSRNRLALVEFGASFPEFRQAAGWQSLGLAEALESCLEDTYPDGPLREASTSSQCAALGRYLSILEGARRRPLPGLAVPQGVRSRVEALSDYLLYSTMPNGLSPVWGDTNPPVSSKSLLLRSADLFGRQDMRWVATGGGSGVSPSTASTEFPDAGFFIMRSGWSPGAAFLALHNGLSDAHGHSDANSFVLSAFGNDLLIDPGAYVSGTPESNLLSRSVSHNTVTMDGMDTVNDRGESDWSTGSMADFYSGTNAGYSGARGEDQNARHRRIVLFVKPALFFVVDVAAAGRPHDWILRDHFAPGSLDASADGASLTFHPAAKPGNPRAGKGGLRIWSAAPDAAHLSIAPGVVAAGGTHKIQAPVAAWAHFQTNTAAWANLLEPFGTSSPTAPWTVRQDEHGTAMAFQTANQAERYLLIRAESEAQILDSWVESSGFSTDAEAASFERRPSGSGSELRRLVLRSGTLFLQVHADTPALVRCEQPVSLLEASWHGDTLFVHRVGGEGIAIRTFGARWIEMNGKRAPIPAGQAILRLPDAPTH